jgi:hypothetical protein
VPTVEPTAPDEIPPELRRAGLPVDQWWFWVILAGAGTIAFAGYKVYQDRMRPWEKLP